MPSAAPTAPDCAPPARPEAPFDALAGLPKDLWRPALITAGGPLERRLQDLPAWRTALAVGQLPPAGLDFGDPVAMAPMRRVAEQLDIAAAARGQPVLADELLRTLLWHLDHVLDLQPRLTREQAAAQVAEALRAVWTVDRADWEQALALLPDAGRLGQRQWDRLRGRLQSREWREAERVQAHLARQPALAALIRRLGRSRHEGSAPARQALPAELGARRLPGRWVETRLPGLPGELAGYRLSDRIESMLPSEAMMLRHPVLRRLWRARQAEGRLLAYDSHALLRDWRPDPLAPPAAAAPPQPAPRERGPILLCLDTSGSMRGAPETLAKAVALEAVRVAHAEDRACLLLAFGGDGELAEQALGPDDDGLDRLLTLMGQGFDGGTDLQAPIERAIAAVDEAGWSSADLLVVSDGEFGCVPATLERLDQARERLGLRVQGVLVGDRETLGLMELCDDIFWVRDWRQHAEGEAQAPSGFSPVHSKSLTALYFPNALSPRAARHHGGHETPPR